MQSYWIVGPAEPSILALDLVGDSYATAAEASGNACASTATPFPSRSSPQTWSRPLRNPHDGSGRCPNFITGFPAPCHHRDEPPR